MADMPQTGSGMRQMYLTGRRRFLDSLTCIGSLDDRIGPRGCAANLIDIYIEVKQC
jgi:hypothetical protein